MRHRPVTASALLLLLLLAGGAGSGASAQQDDQVAVDFVVTPSRLEIRAQPGESLRVPVQVYNRADDALLLDTYVEDVEIPPSELIDPDDLAFTASRWVSFAEPQIEVVGGGDTVALVDVDVPPTTPAGGYHAFGYLQSRPVAGSTGIQPSGRIGVTVLLEVALGDEELDRIARVSRNGIDVRWKNLFDPEVVATTVVDNIGDAHVITGGAHTYRSWPGSGSQIATIGPDTTLRGTRHSFETSWDAVPLFGKVTVTSEIVYQAGPDELPVIISQRSVWIIPWHLIGVLLGAIFVGFFLRRRRKTAQKTTDETTTTRTLATATEKA